MNLRAADDGSECIDMMVVDVEPDGTRVVRVFAWWCNEVHAVDVRFDRVTWDAAKAKEERA